MKIKLIAMRKIGITLLLLFTILKNTSAQKAHEVLEDGIPVEKNDNIFLKVTEDNLKYYIGEKPTRPVSMTDSIIFLVKNSSVNIYLKPINPLNYSYKSENKIILDQIDEEAVKVLKSATDLSSKFINPNDNNTKKIAEKTVTETQFCEFNDLEDKFNNLKINLQTTAALKSTINSIFRKLKELDFIEEKSTVNALDEIEKNILVIEKNYTDIDSELKTFKEKINEFKCNPESNNPFIVKYVFGQLANELEDVKKEQYKRLKNLKKAYDLVKKAQVEASIEKDNLKWCFFIDEVAATKGKISTFTIIINSSGYRLSTEKDKEIGPDEIISDETSEKLKRIIRIRRFERFISEVSSGIAYTNLNFQKFGTITDSISGKTYVTDAGNDIVKRINITTMLNYNYYIQNSPIHPFIQLGVGANVDFPTLLLGGGFRFNANGNRRFALTIGGAASWIKSLDKLSIGAEVAGDGELQKDITYQFAYPKLYYGIQYNF